MAAEKGINFKVMKGVAVICSGILSKKVKYNGEPIDITSDDDNGYRTYLSAPGTKSIDVSIEGVMKDEVLQGLYIGDDVMMTDVILEFSNGDEIAGDFYLSGLSVDYTHDDAVKFSCDLLSSGEFTFTAAP
jgi:predicted secreted protein